MTHLRVERINDRGRHPNKLISFVKEDRRSTTKEEQTQALGVLNRVAAIVFPIMKENGLQVTTLEEHPFNDSYAGINYDAGDCIGLVLRTAHGGWVPENYVLSVMLHELSHCTNMHHASPFWKTLSLYRSRMSTLRSQGYTGEGFWRKGIILGSGDAASLAVPEDTLPKAVCGGAFKGSPFTRRRKRKSQAGSRAKQKKTKSGEKLGGDVERRNALDGSKSKATPRVVKSKRGQELRARAAELRFSQQLSEQFSTCSDSESETDDTTHEKEYKPNWSYKDEDAETQLLLDSEMASMRQSGVTILPSDDAILDTLHSNVPDPPAEFKAAVTSELVELSDTEDESQPVAENELPVSMPDGGPKTIDGEKSVPGGVACTICTLSIDATSDFCEGCGTYRHNDIESWSCKSVDCDVVKYLNHVDTAICGLCGSRRV